MTYTFKYIIVGDSGTGKSCLLLRYTENKFEPMHELTIGVDFGTKIANINGQNIKIQIWDTAGQESFKSIITSYFRGSIGAILVFDVTNRESFNNVKYWMDTVKEKSNTPITIFLIGNKCDLVDNRVISETEAYDFAKKYNLLYMESSSKSGYNVNEVFNNLNTEIYKKIKNNLIDPMYYQTLGKISIDHKIEKKDLDRGYCGIC